LIMLRYCAIIKNGRPLGEHFGLPREEMIKTPAT
jgi:hypothetical protein